MRIVTSSIVDCSPYIAGFAAKAGRWSLAAGNCSLETALPQRTLWAAMPAIVGIGISKRSAVSPMDRKINRLVDYRRPIASSLLQQGVPHQLLHTKLKIGPRFEVFD